MARRISHADLLTPAAFGEGSPTVRNRIPPEGAPGPSLEQLAALTDPLAGKPTHFPATAKSVIWLHQRGAPSSLELYDYKPELEKRAGQRVPQSFLSGVETAEEGDVGRLFASTRSWKQYGDSGAWFSDLLPNLSQHADKIAFIRGSKTVGATHDASTLKMNTGDLHPGRPSLGAWVQYALGSANPDLPGYVVLYAGSRRPAEVAINRSSGFLPPIFQGIAFRPGSQPILKTDRHELICASLRRDSWSRTNEQHRHALAWHLTGRVRIHELSYRMETAAPEAVDLNEESIATKHLYGLYDKSSSDYGTILLRARRLVERGVRFVHVLNAPVNVGDRNMTWDAHEDLEGNHRANAAAVDKPISGLIGDLQARGLLDSTLVVWTSEFGRAPYGHSGSGREHNPWGYTQWLAGGGCKAGSSFGETDELGLKSVGKTVDTDDLRATVLHLLGLDHRRVTFMNNGQTEQPNIDAHVVRELIA